MTWEVMEVGAGAGRGRPYEIRLGVTRQGDKMAMTVGVPGALAKELKWSPGLPIGMNRGTGDHDGWVRLVPEAAAYARALRAMSNSQNMRYVTPMWPGLEDEITETRPPERVEHRIGIATRAGGPLCLDIRLPSWARITDPLLPPPTKAPASGATGQGQPPRASTPFRIGGATDARREPPRGRTMSLGTTSASQLPV